MKLKLKLSVLVSLLLLITGCSLSVNETIYIDDGETVRHSLNAVNGSVVIGEECTIRGNCRSINGGVEIGRGSEVRDIQGVNGQIRIDDDVIVHGDVETVNGDIRCFPGVEINGEIFNINGEIDLEKTKVQRGINTFNGDILLTGETIVMGDIIIEDRNGDSDHDDEIRIEIMENSVVEGDIIVKDDRIEVTVYLSSGGRVLGRIRNAEVIER